LINNAPLRRGNKENTMETMYMNIETRQVDNYEGWYYENEDGEEVNAVDLNEVIMVNGEWVEA
jgi:hypothetical protein